MTRTCTVCAHQDRHTIDKALVAVSDPYRDIARRYGLSKDALVRHKADHLLADLLAAWEAERAQNGQDLVGELRGWMGYITKLLDACDRWLTDPDDATRYDLGPRAHELMVHYEELEATPKGALVARRKARLSDLLPRVTEGREGLTITLIEHKAADPRKLIIDATARLEGHLRILAELVGKLQTQGTTNIAVAPEWLALRLRIVDALRPFPEAGLALAEVLDAEPR
jgi:hypothetical protein